VFDFCTSSGGIKQQQQQLFPIIIKVVKYHSSNKTPKCLKLL
jgi:hypothetical protein